MLARSIVMLLAAVSLELAAGVVQAIPFHALEITLDATVTRVTGGGSFTTRTAAGGVREKTYRVSEIPNFYWQAGQSFRLRWSLTPAEVSQLKEDLVPRYPHYQFLGTTPTDFVPVLCDKLSDNAPFRDVFEFDPPAIGPSVNLESGAVTPRYRPQTFCNAGYCCAYYYDAVADRFVSGGAASLRRGRHH